MSSGIYCYIDKTNDEIIYIGKDSYIDKNIRNKAHFSKCNYNKQQINRVLQNNPNRYEYRILYMGDFNQDLLNTLEINSIAEESPKFNFTIGGDGIAGYNHTEDTKKKMAESQKGDKNPMKNPETAKKVSEALTGRRGPETNMWGKHHSKETKTQISIKGSQQKNTTGYYRVHKRKSNRYKQGFTYRYRYPDDNGKIKEISSVDIKKLEEKVKEAGLEWIKFE